MEDRGNSGARRLCRCYQCHRLEEQLWALAYEQVGPVIRRTWTKPQAPGGADRRVGLHPSARMGMGGQGHG